jgi:hypothetical protein
MDERKRKRIERARLAAERAANDELGQKLRKRIAELEQAAAEAERRRTQRRRFSLLRWRRA